MNYVFKNLVLDTDSCSAFLFRAGFAVYAAIYFVFSVHKLEFMRQLLFNGGYTARVFAFYDIFHDLRQLKMKAVYNLAVFYYVDGNTGVKITQNVKIYVNQCVNFQNVLFAHFDAVGVLDNRNGAVKLAEI